MRYVEFIEPGCALWPAPMSGGGHRAGYTLLGSLADLWTITSALYNELRWEVFE